MWKDILEQIQSNSGTVMHPSTRRALVSNGLIEIAEQGYSVTRSGRVYIKMVTIIAERGHVTAWKNGAKYGMYCSMDGNHIVDCWGKPYDLSDVKKLEKW